MKQNKAFTIGIEGSDGAGKETQTTLLRTALESLGKKVTSISFPRYQKTCGGKLLYEAFKSERAPQYEFSKTPPEAASLIYAADRLESLPFLNELISSNDVVIFDRYVESNLLHQGGKLSSGKRETFAKWLYGVEYELNGLPHPDLMIYLSVPYEVSIARAEKRAMLKGDKPDFLEQNKQYVKQGNEAGIFYANLFNWNIITCVSKKGKSLYELTAQEVHSLILKALPPDIIK